MNPVTWWKAVGAQCKDLPDGFIELMITLQSRDVIGLRKNSLEGLVGCDHRRGGSGGLPPRKF